MLLLLLVWSAPALSIDRKPLQAVDPGQMIVDGQVQGGGDNEFAMLWWIPLEFWEVSMLRQGGGIETPIVDALRPYFLLGIVRARISKLGGFDFVAREKLREGLVVRHQAPGKRESILVPVEDLEPDVEIILGTIRPVLANAMGNLGANMQFFTMTDSVEDGVTPISPYERGTLTFEVAADGNLPPIKRQIETPFNSLFEPRFCPGGKEAHVSWTVCPWDGSPLKP
jgi:hypothetical protein